MHKDLMLLSTELRFSIVARCRQRSGSEKDERCHHWLTHRPELSSQEVLNVLLDLVEILELLAQGQGMD